MAGKFLLSYSRSYSRAQLTPQQMHCHIGWHTSEGLALQFVEREAEIPGMLNSTSVLQDTCTAWRDWADSIGIEEEDSGV